MRLVKKYFPGGEVESETTHKTDGPLNRPELKRRLAYTESKFNVEASRKNGATGLFQIMPIALKHYNTKNKTSYTKDDLLDPVINTMIRNYLFDLGEYSSVANPQQSGDSIRYAKALSIFNYGKGNVSNKLMEAKNNGVDIYDSWDWLSYMPLETLDYVNFILRGQDVNTNKTVITNKLYNKATKDNKATVLTINKTKRFK